LNDPIWNHDEETRLAHYIVERITGKASGRLESECIRNYPRDIYFVGNLRPHFDEDPDASPQPGHLRELMNKLAPVAFGAEFLLQMEGENIQINVQLSWSCYYRVFPTLSQQRAHQRYLTIESVGQGDGGNEQVLPPLAQESPEDVSEQENTNSESTDTAQEVPESANDRRRTRIAQDTLSFRFRKIRCSTTGLVSLQRVQNSDWIVNTEQLQTAIDQEILRAQQAAIIDPERVRSTGNADEKIKVPESALRTIEDYNSFLHSFTNDIAQQWLFQVRGELWNALTTTSSERVLALEFVNRTTMPVDSANTESFIFDTEAVFTFSCRDIRPFQINLAPKSFRYDKLEWGRGINCGIHNINNDPSLQSFVTTHTPVYQQMRFTTRTSPPARFADLRQNPLPVLTSILSAMEEYRNVWNRERRNYVLVDPAWEANFAFEFDRDYTKYNEEITRFKRGCEIIEQDQDVRLAFQLVNETFHRGPKTEWRLFQIVFFVSQIPGIHALASVDSRDLVDREKVDIIYFPTGGGKTEAYLATIIFHCFFDRLRGKSAGVTAWTRFPLRLLTLQQTQRVADVIGVAEIVRREQNDVRLSGPDVDGFAVGYFVGQGGSPNEIVNPDESRYPNAEAQVVWSKVNDANARQDWKRVVRCPSCGTNTVSVEFDAIHTRLFHRCNCPGCSFPGGIIPIYIVDNEIYRYLPSVIVGTIDKLAGVGNQRKFSLLFGEIDGRCSQHGYYKGGCCQKDCLDRSRLQRFQVRGISGPTLFVQDELHLLKEGLGTFDAHYETFAQQLQREFGQMAPLKIIASSATIEAFERQVNHLYGRSENQACVFPGPGPILGQSFYAETLTRPQRLYVGLLPHNKTIFNTILELIEMYHHELEGLKLLSEIHQNPYGGILQPNTPQWHRLLDFYSSSLTYFLANRELSSTRTDLEGDVIPHLVQDGLPALEVSELTGSTSTDDVSRILEKLEQIAQLGSSPDTILATSMISHGVDVDRLNSMIFYGMPRQNSEYIQASSRVGRSHVGIVFTCLHPVRERDRSHYSYFSKFHEFIGQMIEPVAINRWAKFSINRTLPGLFMGVLLQLVANRSGENNPGRYTKLDFVRRKISDGTLRPEFFISMLERAYGVQTPVSHKELVFHTEIRLRVRQYFDWILTAGSDQTFISDVLIPKPMRSLRDVDEAIPIELDSLGSIWTTRGTRP